ncbi:MAG: hypothetical protein ACPGJS_05515 [Flammeovirgaceae bacterium]
MIDTTFTGQLQGIQIESSQRLIEKVRIDDFLTNITKVVIINARLVDRLNVLPDKTLTFQENSWIADEQNFYYGSEGIIEIHYQFAATTEVNNVPIGTSIVKKQIL